MGNRAYLNRINKIIELQNEIKELESVIDSLKDELKADMIKNETEEITAGDYTIRYKAVVSNKFDSKAFKAAHSKLYSAFCKTTSSMRFTIN